MKSNRLALHWQILIGMVAGAVLGLSLNFFAGRSSITLDEKRLAKSMPDGVAEILIDANAASMMMSVKSTDNSVTKYSVDPTGAVGKNTFLSHAQFAKSHPKLAAIYLEYGQPLATRWGLMCKRFGGLFLRMLQMVAVPLIVTSLASGIMGLGGGEHLGRMFGKTLVYYGVTSALAIVTGIIAVNIVRPGLRGGLAVNQAVGADAVIGESSLSEVLMQQIEALIPANPIGALAEPNFLSVISFTLAVAIFARRAGGRTKEVIGEFVNAAADVMMRLTSAIIMLAPLGVFFLMAYVPATQGIDVFKALGWYMIAVASALLFHAVVTLPLIVKFIAKRSPWEFATAMSPALLTAFSTASSNGTLPLTMQCVEERGKVSKRTGSFVLPLGATINMDGTALYEAVAVLFIAQLYFQANLPLDQQFIVAITALLASVGAAGIPHAGLVMMVIILQAVNLPIELQGIILAVDRVLDMCRTTVNVWSDSCGAATIDALSMDDVAMVQA